MKAIADGTYYDEQPYGRGEWGDDELRKARTVYRLLFQMVDDLDEACEELAVYLPDFSPDLHLRDAMARYCRCVYETTPLVKRVSAMLGALNIHAHLNSSMFDVYDNDHPMLRDVIGRALRARR